MSTQGKDVCAGVEEMLSEHLRERGLEIWRVEYKKEGPDWKLRVYLDKAADAEDEYVGIDECEEAARYLSERLDDEDFIDRSYVLEVASPGMDRELRRPEDFVRYAGRLVDLKLYEPIDGSRQLSGELKGLINGDIVICADDREYKIPEKKVSKINLAIVI